MSAHFKSIRLTFAAVPLLLLLAPAADATTYKADREGFGMLLRVHGHQVVRLATHYTLHCDNGRVSHALLRQGYDPDEPFRLPINRRTGRFIYRYVSPVSDVRPIFKQRLVGTVRQNTIRGRFKERYGATCWTGSSKSDPWIHFVARPIGAPSQGLG